MNTIELPTPAMMSASARAAEITRILAAAMIRSQISQPEKSRTPDLGFLPDQRVHATPYLQEESLR